MKLWSRKDAIANTVEGKHITLGSVVRNKSNLKKVHGTRAGGYQTLPVGAVGKVISSGKAEGWSCKMAIGTTQGFLVDWGE